jgi:hypothetical protein
MQAQHDPARRTQGMTTPGTALRPAPRPDTGVEDLAARLCRALAGTRDEGRFTIEQFLDAAERGYGGQLTWTAPHKGSKRTIFEAGYRSERHDGRATA